MLVVYTRTLRRLLQMNGLIISDLHAPFHHPAAVDFLSDLRRRVRPTWVVCIGDEIDAHGWSRHGRHPDAPGQADELELCRPVLRDLYKLFPRVQVCRSNHGERAARLATKVGLSSAWLRDYRDVLEAPKGWQWAWRWVVGDILFEHGEGYSGENVAKQVALANRRNSCIGHVHTQSQVYYHSNGTDTIWGMSTGCLVDTHSLAFDYSRKGPRRPIIGTAVVEDGVPRIEPLRV